MMIKKAVFPVAGLGTRFLPATKANPKEMLPIVDKPLIQYAVEEAIQAGINELIFVTSSTKRAIEDHFDRDYQLEASLRQKNKTDLLELVESIVPAHVQCVYVRQSQQLGLGHAVNCAKNLVGDEAFAVLLADDLISQNNPGCLAGMLTSFTATKQSVLCVEQVPKSETDKYGVVSFSAKNIDTVNPIAINQIVEKPQPEKAPSNMAVIGRYILTPQVFKHLDEIGLGAGNEIQLTDAIARLMQEESVYAHVLQGKRYDCGSKLGYLQATVDFGLQHPQLGQEFSEFLRGK